MSEGISVYNGATNTLVKGNVAKSNNFNGIDIEGDAGAGTDVGGNVALQQWPVGHPGRRRGHRPRRQQGRRQRPGRPVLGRRLHPAITSGHRGNARSRP